MTTVRAKFADAGEWLDLLECRWKVPYSLMEVWRWVGLLRRFSEILAKKKNLSVGKG